MRKLVILNKFGRVIGVADSIADIARGLSVPEDKVLNAYNSAKLLLGKYLILSRNKHEYLWHKYGGRHGGDDHFAFCTPEELRAYKEGEKITYPYFRDRYKPMRL